jgi:hypothetical protein
MFLQNTGLSPNYTVLQPRSPYSSQSLLWEPRIQLCELHSYSSIVRLLKLWYSELYISLRGNQGKSYIILLDIHIKKNHMEVGDRYTKVKTDDCDMDCKQLAQNTL